MQFWNGLLRGGETPEELVVATVTAGTELLEHPESAEALATVTRRLSAMKHALIGDVESDADEARCSKLAAAVVKLGLVPVLVNLVPVLPLEPRKDASHVFNNLLHRNLDGAFARAVADPDILRGLASHLAGPPDLAVSCAAMLREAVKKEDVTRALLAAGDGDLFWTFFVDYITLPNFDVASDALEIVKFVLTGHPSQAAPFVARHYSTFFRHYNALLTSDNYVTCRESLRLLGELLLDRTNFNTMMKYISAAENLKILMNLLRNKKVRIQIEAFHVFKVFVANPRKPPEILRILYQNREKLVAYLANLSTDRPDDQFEEEKALIIETLTGLEQPPPPTTSTVTPPPANASPPPS